MAGKPSVRSGHRPINTLRRSQPGTAISKAIYSPLPQIESRAQLPAPKRQKTSHDEPEIQSRPATAMSERPRRPDAVPIHVEHSAASSQNTRRNGSNIFSIVMSTVASVGAGPPKPKKKRRRSDNEQASPSTRGSDHTSRRGEEFGPSPSPQKNGTPPREEYACRSNADRIQSPTLPDRPPINLDAGLSSITSTSLREKQSAGSIRPAGQVPPTKNAHRKYQASLTSGRKPPSISASHPYDRGDANATVTAKSSLDLRSRIESPEAERSTKHSFKLENPEDRNNTRHIFKPDDGRAKHGRARLPQDPRKRRKVRDQMESNYAFEQHKDQFSEDELAGGQPITGSVKNTVQDTSDQSPLPSSHILSSTFTTRDDLPQQRQLTQARRQRDASTSSLEQFESSEPKTRRSQADEGGVRRALEEDSQQIWDNTSSPATEPSHHFARKVQQPRDSAFRMSRTRITPSKFIFDNISASPPSSPAHPPQESRRRSTRSTVVATEAEREATPERWSQVNKLGPWLRSVVYPANGLRRATVTCKDVERLDEGEFLNDSIIAYALRRIEELTPHRDQIHFFNSFFYTAMSTKAGSRARGLNYDAVKKWTKGKDLLHKQYIIVPINYDLHWFTAIICNLPKLLNPHEVDVADEPSSAIESLGEQALKDGPTDPQAECLESSQDKEPQMEATQQFSSMSLDERSPVRPAKKKPKRRTAPVRKYDPEQPAIIILDSLGVSRATEVGILKDYIVAEAADKHGLDLSELRKSIQGVSAKGLPEQTNYCDCGVYLIAYLEAFAKDPRSFVQKLLQRNIDPSVDFAGFEPSAKRAAIRNQLIELHQEQEVDRLESKQAKGTPYTTKTTPPVAMTHATTTEMPQREFANADPTQPQPYVADHLVEKQSRRSTADLAQQRGEHSPGNEVVQRRQEASPDHEEQPHEENAAHVSEVQEQRNAIGREGHRPRQITVDVPQSQQQQAVTNPVGQYQEQTEAEALRLHHQQTKVDTEGQQHWQTTVDLPQSPQQQTTIDLAGQRPEQTTVEVPDSQEQQAAIDSGEHQHYQKLPRTSTYESDEQLEQEPLRPLLSKSQSSEPNKRKEPYNNAKVQQQSRKEEKATPIQTSHLLKKKTNKVTEVLSRKRQSRLGLDTNDRTSTIPVKSSVIEID